MNAYDLQKEIDLISLQIIKKYRPQKIILFGSAAQRKFTPDSDLDFFIIKDDPRPGPDRISEVMGMFTHNIATDVLIYTPTEVEKCLKWGDPFVKEIINTGRVLYG
ncbi:MAG: nucleotidyltransferase domain-containing protein [Candidatus Margulisbacteria bacterium]|nr:nucleotidyltransferase domain-containing protein [Candidatus Margulisiibacteriota bacterium]